jgi:hypothetical protein
MSGFLERWAKDQPVSGAAIATAYEHSSANGFFTPSAEANRAESRKTDQAIALSDATSVSGPEHGVVSLASPPESRLSCESQGDRSNTAKALREVAHLLAAAYQRYTTIQRVPVQRPEDEVTKELALSPPESVHGRG